MLNTEMLRPILRAAWGPDTCDPHDRQDWRPDNPARGQRGVGRRTQQRPPGAPRRCRPQYELLSSRVRAALR